MSLETSLSPAGRLSVAPSSESEPKLVAATVAQLSGSFASSSAQGLECLATDCLEGPLPADLAYWREFARRYFTALCHRPASGESADAPLAPVPPPDEAILAELTGSSPPLRGLEYVNPAVLGRLWEELDVRVRTEVDEYHGGRLQSYLQAKNPAWNAVGRVTFHLAENKRDPDHPFAFLATYTHGLSDQGRVQHLPMGRALQEYAGAKNRAALASLLSPVQRAAEKGGLARELLESRAIFQPQVWTSAAAFRFLKDIPRLEESGISVRIPDWWKSGRPPRPQVSVKIGEEAKNRLGQGSLLDFKIELALDGQPLTAKERETILNSSHGLVLLKGKWVEVDPERLKEVLDHWKRVQADAGSDGVSLIEGMRLLSGFTPADGAQNTDASESRPDWTRVSAGEWFKRALAEMQKPAVSAESDPGPELLAKLRPYQREGVHWLWTMNQLGLGACLADDMGLGKTLQVIALLLARRRRSSKVRPSLLVVPASLIANWRAEIRRFAPALSVFFAHPSEADTELLAEVAANPEKGLGGRDLVVTSYGLLLRLPWLTRMEWDIVVLDEAQAIKNPGARQSRSVKELRARHRIALTGTPIENRLSDLWSLFDFLCPGLLGTTKEFSAFAKSRIRGDGSSFSPLRQLVRPYILRRMKTDKRVIADLPEKTEIDAFCGLSRTQAALYGQAVQDLETRLAGEGDDGIGRRGLIFAFLTRFKQICNHPSQWLGDGAYRPSDSGKFQRLRELAEEIAARQEKLLVFTQYREITAALAGFLAEVFGRPGLVLHGETAVGKRQDLVDDFQRDGGPPFFVLSLKAGGTGLNLTAASHVIHFDRWWNPAVENQATDRAFRIGQRRNVVVHKFTCRGTLEEKIHSLIADKMALAEDILGGGAERLLTEMKNDELLRFVALDIKSASGE
ncbi:MAG TPA: DEAD/DEAH box helicase [Opitutaceae bacterium]|jgi:non-specific serine/threonine protein kinase